MLNEAYDNGSPFTSIVIPSLCQGVAGLWKKSGYLAEINNHLQEKLNVFNTVSKAGGGSLTVSAATVKEAILPESAKAASATGGAKSSRKAVIEPGSADLAAVGGAKPDVTEEVPFNYSVFYDKFTDNSTYAKSEQSQKVLRLVDPGTTMAMEVSTEAFLSGLRKASVSDDVTFNALSSLDLASGGKLTFETLFKAYVKFNG